MKKYHYSVLFDGCDIRHHGEFDSSFNDQTQIVNKARKEIDYKLPKWGFSGQDVIETEIYYVENDEEKKVFTYKKQQKLHETSQLSATNY